MTEQNLRKTASRRRQSAQPETHDLSIRITLGPNALIGPGKIALLERVRDQGSISAAARVMGMSYKRAWELVDQVNAMFAKPAVVTSKGGRSGGGAVVSELGQELIRAYRALEGATVRACQAEFDGVRRAMRRG